MGISCASMKGSPKGHYIRTSINDKKSESVVLLNYSNLMYGDLPENSQNGGLSPLTSYINELFQSSRKSTNDIELSSNSSNSDGAAVVVKRAFKNYGRIQVLHGLNMNVAKGSIYGLLGASGCGKTTLLGCIVGIKRLNCGDVYVLGEKLPGTLDEKRIGYMPQSTGLYGEFTVSETLLFFGRVIGMKESQIKERSRYLTDLLVLPERLVKNLSGGQQRRVSLAVALLHEPELLILDEPTVGVDCILRQLIWDHFFSLTVNADVTIIITTHYIEEARQANRVSPVWKTHYCKFSVGIMRGGCLMAEAAPDFLIKQHQAKTLEEVFSALSVQQNRDKIRETDDDLHFSASQRPLSVSGKWTFKPGHMKALVWKNALWLYKNFVTLTMVTLLPVIMVSLFCTAIGHDPINLTVGVVNLEVGNRHCNATLICGSEEVSCAFLRYLEDRGMVVRHFSTEDEAVGSVMKGETYASMVIKQNYSRGLHARAYDWNGISVSEMVGSTIDVFRDLSNKHLAIHIQVTLYKSFQEFFYDYVESCGLRWEIMRVPLKWETVYGDMKPNFTDSSIPGVLPSITFIIGVILTSHAILIERNEASLERTYAMGVNKLELLIAYIVIEYAIMSIQTLLIMVFVSLVFGMTMKGCLVLVFVLLALCGFCGMCFGLLISCVTNSQVGITLAALGSYFSIILTNGLLWPTEAMHWLLKPFAPLLPLSKSTESLRNILHRDWGMFQGDVYVGFISVIIWCFIFLLFSIIVIKFQKS